MELILIRHGQTPNNVTGALDTAVPGAALTDLGRAQAAAVPGALGGTGIAAIYASPLVRTQLTAAPLATVSGLEVQVRPGLEEIGAGDLEMRVDDDARHAYAETVGRWLHGDLAARLPGGPDGEQFYARFDAAIAGIVAGIGDDATVVAFSHGAAIRAYTALTTGFAPAAAEKLSIANTGAAFLTRAAGGAWRLARWSSEPLGGADLLDASALDVTGESVEEEQASA